MQLIEVKKAADGRLVSNQDLEEYKPPKLIKQMESYAAFINEQEKNISHSYLKIAANYLDLINKEILPENYFPHIKGIGPKKILGDFIKANVKIDHAPYMLIIGDKNKLSQGRNRSKSFKKAL